MRGLVEKPNAKESPSNLAVIGRYILEPSVLQHLGRLRPGAGGELQLTDAIAKLIGESPLYGYRFEGRRFDCGDKIGFFEANLAFTLARPDLAPAAHRLLERYAAARAEEEDRTLPYPSLRTPKADVAVGV